MHEMSDIPSLNWSSVQAIWPDPCSNCEGNIMEVVPAGDVLAALPPLPSAQLQLEKLGGKRRKITMKRPMAAHMLLDCDRKEDEGVDDEEKKEEVCADGGVGEAQMDEEDGPSVAKRPAEKRG